MLIRKNTREFKTILHLVEACRHRGDREKLVRLYITKAGHSIHDRIGVEGIQGQSGLFYEMTYEAVLSNLKSSNHQLHVSDEVPGIYFFHSASNKVWPETPFEFDETIKKEFSTVAELPLVRKKEKVQEFSFPSTASTSNIGSTPSATNKRKSAAVKEPKAPPTKVAKIADKIAKQPDFKLRHEIYFNNLNRIIYRQAQVSKEDVLTYYSKISEYILPYLNDRPVWASLYSDNRRTPVEVTIRTLLKEDINSKPAWIKTIKVSAGKQQTQMIECNDREHLLFCVESGCLEFNPGHSRVRSINSPDYIVFVLESPDSELGKVVDAALAVKGILTGLELPCFVKTDGISGLHIYVPLDAKSTFKTAGSAAAYISKLVRLKVPELITLKGTEGYVFGKVSLDITVNEAGKSIVAPYSLVAGPSPTVAAPVSWDEVTAELRVEDFNYETILSRLKERGDAFEGLLKKKVNAQDLLERLIRNYAFLLQ